MRERIKRLVAALLLGVLLCGGTATVQAASASVYADHTHVFVKTFVTTIRSVHSTHQYVSGTIYDANLNVIGYTYGTCDIMTYLDEYVFKCSKCAATNGTTTDTRVSHSVSH